MNHDESAVEADASAIDGDAGLFIAEPARLCAGQVEGDGGAGTSHAELPNWSQVRSLAGQALVGRGRRHANRLYVNSWEQLAGLRVIPASWSEKGKSGLRPLSTTPSSASTRFRAAAAWG